MDEVTGSNLTFREKGKKRFSSRKVQRNVVIILFLFAPLLLLIVFTYLPFTDMVRYSFFKWNGTSKTMKYIGLKNYIEVFTRPEYFAVLRTSLYYLVGSFVQIALALYFATILNFKVRFSNFFKGAIFFPYLINGVAIGFVFLYFFKSGGTLNSILTAFGVAEEKIPLWLNNRSLINVSLASVSVWRYMGQNMVMFSGAMASVNSDLYEASQLDGANRWQQFCYIILPNIKLVVSLNMILAVKGAISVFEIPYIMTNGGNGSATFVTKTLETAFTMKKVGLASAMGVVLLTFILIITLIQKKFFEGREA